MGRWGLSCALAYGEVVKSCPECRVCAYVDSGCTVSGLYSMTTTSTRTRSSTTTTSTTVATTLFTTTPRTSAVASTFAASEAYMQLAGATISSFDNCKTGFSADWSSAKTRQRCREGRQMQTKLVLLHRIEEEVRAWCSSSWTLMSFIAAGAIASAAALAYRNKARGHGQTYASIPRNEVDVITTMRI